MDGREKIEKYFKWINCCNRFLYKKKKKILCRLYPHFHPPFLYYISSIIEKWIFVYKVEENCLIKEYDLSFFIFHISSSCTHQRLHTISSAFRHLRHLWQQTEERKNWNILKTFGFISFPFMFFYFSYGYRFFCLYTVYDQRLPMLCFLFLEFLGTKI